MLDVQPRREAIRTDSKCLNHDVRCKFAMYKPEYKTNAIAIT